MKKFYKEHLFLVHILFLIIISILEVFLLTGNKYVFGSQTDWMKQSVSFYEYFRNLFYNTKNFFPNLALHIGGGQNIYYFAYYGLFSPMLIISYFLPFISSGDFLMIHGVLNILISSILLYIFLVKNDFDKNKSFVSALLFLSNYALILNNCKQIMFISYMPFLLLGLLGVKKYIDTNKSFLLIISVSLIILSSYYFSITCILCILIYAGYYSIKKFELKKSFKNIFKICTRIFISIVIVSFLLIPVAYIIFNSRKSAFNISIYDFLPILGFRYAYNKIRITAVIWIALIYNIVCLKKSNKFMAIIIAILFSFPIFNLLLNGFLYVDGKVFIPFIPLLIMMFTEMISSISNAKNKKLYIIFICYIILIKFIYVDFSIKIAFIDFVVTIILLMMYKNKNNLLYIFPIILLSFAISYYIFYISENLVLKKDYKNTYEVINDYKELNDTNSIYRYYNNLDMNLVNYSDANNYYTASVYSSTSNIKYNDIFYNVFNNNARHPNSFVLYQDKNLFFQKFMGLRYILLNGDAPYGYSKIKDYKYGSLFENKNVYSIGFASNHLLNYDEYKNLSFIEKLEAFNNNIIVDEDSYNSDLDFNYEKISLDYNILDYNNISFKEENDHYLITSNNGSINLSLNDPIKDKTLVIRFDMNNIPNCNEDYLSITINDIKNTLRCESNIYSNKNKTFDYVISSNNDITNLNIDFNKGEYDISNLQIYTIDNSYFDKNDTIPISIDFDNTKGDKIFGSIDMPYDGYFIFTIPYDYGYTILVDDKEIDIKLVNEGFIGFKLDKGYHIIKVSFEAPYSKLGKIISILGIITFIFILLYEKKYNTIVDKH